MPAITVRVVDQFGKSTVHPICAAARIFASIAGTKTLSPPNIERIRFLGYEILLDDAPAIVAARQTHAGSLGAARGATFEPTASQIRTGLTVPVLELR